MSAALEMIAGAETIAGGRGTSRESRVDEVSEQCSWLGFDSARTSRTTASRSTLAVFATVASRWISSPCSAQRT